MPAAKPRAREGDRRLAVVTLGCGARSQIRLARAVRPWRESFQVLTGHTPATWSKQFAGVGCRGTILLVDMASIDDVALDLIGAASATVGSAPLVVAIGNQVNDALRAFEIGAVDIVDPEQPSKRFSAVASRVRERFDQQQAASAAFCTAVFEDGKLKVGGVSFDAASIVSLQQVGNELRIRIPAGEVRLKTSIHEFRELEAAGIVWVNDTTAVAIGEIGDYRSVKGSTQVTAVFIDGVREWVTVAPSRRSSIFNALRTGAIR